MKRSLVDSLSWSLALASAVALGIAGCSPEERNFGDPSGTSSSSGTGGAGGSGMVCMPDASEACYSGTPETLEVGVCKSGVHVCLPEGNGFSECGGEVLPTVEDCLTPEDEACNGDDPAECPTLADGWLKTFGSVGSTQTVQDIAITNTGEIVVVGAFFDTVDFGKGPMASTGSSDIFVAKFDQLGNAIWSRRFGDASSQAAFAVAVDNMGAIYVGGSMAGSVDFDGTLLTSAGGDDAFLARFEPDGKFAWAHNWGDLNSQVIRQIEVTKTNTIVVAGEFKGTIEFDLQGGIKLTSAGSTDVFVARFDTSGFVAGARGFGGTGIDTVRGLAAGNANEIYFTGGFEGTANFNGPVLTSTGLRDAYVAMLASNLNTIKVLGFGNPNGPMSFQEGFDVAINANDDIFVSGVFQDGVEMNGMFLVNPNSLARTMFLAHFTPQFGALAQVQPFGGLKDGVVFDSRLAIDPMAKQVVVAGSFTGDMNFGGSPLHAEGLADPFFAKLAFDGTIAAARSLPNEVTPSDNANNINALALLPMGDLIIGGVERTPIVYSKGVVGQTDSKFGDAMLGRFLH